MPLLSLAATILRNTLPGDSGQAALAEKTRHDKALEAYQAAMAQYTLANARSSLTGLKPTERVKARGKSKLHKHRLRVQALQPSPPRLQINSMPTKPKFSAMYQPSELQKQGELLFVGGGALALGYAAFRFL